MSFSNAVCHGMDFETTIVNQNDRIIDQLDRVIELLESFAGQPQNDVNDELQKRADSNRDNAAELFGDVIYFGCFRRECTGREEGKKCHAGEEGATAWRRRDNGKRVVFTPYGWVDEPV